MHRARPVPPPGPPRRAAPPPHRSYRRWLWLAAGIGAFAAVVVISGVFIIKRVETGRWEVPEAQDFVRIVRLEKRGPSKTIFLERHAIALVPGLDDAPRGISSVVANAGNKAVKLPGWKGSEAGWKKVVKCVRDLFAPFDVEVTDQRPAHDDFVLVVVGGTAKNIGAKNTKVSGLAPFNGGVIPKPIVFAFSAAVKNDVRATCETIGMEVAHAYGLDHGYECKDVMTYLGGCGAKRFVDKDVRCGEGKPRPCEGGAATQNSFRHLVDVLGARPATGK